MQVVEVVLAELLVKVLILLVVMAGVEMECALDQVQVQPEQLILEAVEAVEATSHLATMLEKQVAQV
tara:strand:- start:187 stop:387 length:201 start_codon:yes stop_codon:yes gene_type:complete